MVKWVETVENTGNGGKGFQGFASHAPDGVQLAERIAVVADRQLCFIVGADHTPWRWLSACMW